MNQAVDPLELYESRESWRDLYEYGRECLRAVYLSNCEEVGFTPTFAEQESWIDFVAKDFDKLSGYSHGQPDHEYGFAHWAERELRRYA